MTRQKYHKSLEPPLLLKMVGLEAKIAQNKTKQAQVSVLFVSTNGTDAFEVVTSLLPSATLLGNTSTSLANI